MKTFTAYRNRQGYTLLEIMIVVALIGSVGLFAMANLRGKMPGYYLDRATTQLVNDLNSARMRAISQALPADISINSSAKTYSIWVDTNTNGTADVGETVKRSLADVPGLTMKTLPSESLSFSPRGRLPGINHFWRSRLEVDNAGKCDVNVLPSGLVLVTRQDMDWSPDVE
jgi:prepilin-type N-terminal cleavage/methylation domain-containing protein